MPAVSLIYSKGWNFLSSLHLLPIKLPSSHALWLYGFDYNYS